MIKEATIEDIPRIAEIHVCGWRYAYRGIISDHELFTHRLVSRSIHKFEQRFQEHQHITVYVDERDHILKGFAWHGKSRDDDLNNVYEIYAIYVQPEFMRQQIGTSLMQAVEEQAHQEQYHGVHVWVFEKNHRAHMFYRKNHYHKDGQRKFIDAWNEDEIRMIKYFTH